MKQSYLETVHEEDLTSTAADNTANTISAFSEPDGSKTPTPPPSIDESKLSGHETTPEKIKSSISVQPNVDVERTLIESSSSVSSGNNETDHLYHQLSELKPFKAKNFKSSTCICLNIKEPAATPDVAPQSFSSCSMLITPSTPLSSSNMVESASVDNVGNEAAKTTTSFTTSKTNSTTFISLNKVHQSKPISVRLNDPNNNNNDLPQKSMNGCDDSSTRTVISRRNSSFVPPSSYSVNVNLNNSNGISSSLSSSSANNAASMQNAPHRRVSLSVTDL